MNCENQWFDSHRLKIGYYEEGVNRGWAGVFGGNNIPPPHTLKKNVDFELNITAPLFFYIFLSF